MSDAKAHPTDLSGTGWLAVTRRVMGELGPDHVGIIAAGCAFYGLLAIFPGVVALMALAGLFVDQTTVVSQFEPIARVLPQEAASIILDQARAVAGSDEGGLGLAAIFGLLIAFYSASSGVGSLIEGLNVAFDVKEKRGVVELYLRKFMLTLGMMFGAMLIVLTLAIIPIVLSFVSLGDTSEMIVSFARWPIVLAIVIVGLAVMYRYGPSKEDLRWRWATPGAIIATALWLLGSLGFSFYVSNFGSYNETFGALGGVIILLMWLWISSFIILLGAEFDAEIEAQAKIDPQPATSDPEVTGSDELARLKENGPIPGDERLAT